MLKSFLWTYVREGLSVSILSILSILSIHVGINVKLLLGSIRCCGIEHRSVKGRRRQLVFELFK